VAERFGAKFEVHPWSGQINQCRVALSRCTQPWVCAWMPTRPCPRTAGVHPQDFFRRRTGRGMVSSINRCTFYLGRWISTSGIPNWRLRLARRMSPNGSARTALRFERLRSKLRGWTATCCIIPFAIFRITCTRASNGRASAYGTENVAQSFPWAGILFAPGDCFPKQLVMTAGDEGWRGWLSPA